MFIDLSFVSTTNSKNDDPNFANVKNQFGFVWYCFRKDTWTSTCYFFDIAFVCLINDNTCRQICDSGLRYPGSDGKKQQVGNYSLL